jgi:hypothetical protein
MGKGRWSRGDVTRVRCGVVGGIGVSHPIVHGWRGGGLSAMVLKVLPRDCGSHSLDHGVLDGDCYGGARGKSWGTRGGMNGGLACCIGEP